MREILLVEDDPEICDALVEILADYGYSVVWHADGHDGLVWLQQAVELPPVILLDLQLPTMNGWDFVDVLRLDDRLNRIPIIVMSAMRDKPPPNIVAFLPKPIQLDRLLKALDQYCPPVA